MREQVLLHLIEEVRNRVKCIAYRDSSKWVLDERVTVQTPVQVSSSLVEEISTLSLSIVVGASGENSLLVTGFQEGLAKARQDSHKHASMLGFCLGRLNALETTIKSGLLRNLEAEIAADIFVDFIASAKAALGEGHHGVAAVLGSAALEDCLKRRAILAGLETKSKSMTEVVNALKRAGVVTSAQAKLLDGHIKIRNKAFHAEFDGITGPEISSLIGFTEQFLTENLA